MNLKKWEAMINQIAADSIQVGSRDKVLIACRRKLENEPPTLHPCQIDEIVREVRKRVSAVSR